MGATSGLRYSGDCESGLDHAGVLGAVCGTDPASNPVLLPGGFYPGAALDGDSPFQVLSLCPDVDGLRQHHAGCGGAHGC